VSIDGAVTPSQQRGGCADGSMQREGQALARRSDLRDMQAQPCFHAMMPGCLWSVWSSLPPCHPCGPHNRIPKCTARFCPSLSEVIGARVCVISHTPANCLQSGLCIVPQGIKLVCNGMPCSMPMCSRAPLTYINLLDPLQAACPASGY